jgi:electron transport complex protein RnfE
VVNCIILGRAEAFASKNPVLYAAADGLGMGMGFTISLTMLGSLRELLGYGTVFGNQIMPTGYKPFTFMIEAPGAFVCLGLMLCAMNFFTSWQARRKGQAVLDNPSHECRSCGICSR